MKVTVIHSAVKSIVGNTQSSLSPHSHRTGNPALPKNFNSKSMRQTREIQHISNYRRHYVEIVVVALVQTQVLRGTGGHNWGVECGVRL